MDSLTEFAARAGCELLSLPVHGGSASVYRARCRRQGTLVAFKLLHPGRDPDRLRDEARTLARLDHPCIVRRVRSGAVDGVPFLMTAWVDGVSLSRLFGSRADAAQPGLSLEHGLQLLAPLIGALDHAHARGIVHADLTPANVLITPQQRVVLIDFGGGHDAADVTLTAHDDLIGTPRYLAPELIRGASPDPLSDQYAAALLGYEMLTGHWPFTQGSRVAAAALHHQLYTEPTPLSEHRPDLPAGIDGVFERALSKRPEDRHAGLKEFHEALARYSARSVGAARHAAPALPCITPATSGRAVADDRSAHRPVSIGRRGWRRGWRSAPGLGVLSLCALGLTPASSLIATDGPCNLYPNADFDTALVPNFYQDPDNRDAATRVDARSSDGSSSLRLGTSDVYGLYGVTLEIDGGRDYRFEASLTFEGYVHKAELQVVWLDEDWQTIDGATVAIGIDDRSDGHRARASASAPEHAHHAVPTLYKDASAGTLYADAIAFAPVTGACAGSNATVGS